MQSGLCPGPGQYEGTVYMGDTSRERMANRQNGLCPGCALAPMQDLSLTTAPVSLQMPATAPGASGLETTRPGAYAWMYNLPGLAGGQVAPVATRNVINGSVLLGVSGTDLGPQFLHVHALLPNGEADAGAAISAYLYQRGYVDEGHSLNLIRHGGGEYMIRFDPTQQHGDTLAVRVMRPGMADQVVYFSLAGPEL